MSTGPVMSLPPQHPPLNLHPLSPVSINKDSPFASYLQSAEALLATFPESFVSGTKHGEVLTWKRKKSEKENRYERKVFGGEEYWAARKSHHIFENGYDAFKSGIYANHTLNEKEYMGLKSVELLDTFAGSPDGTAEGISASVWYAVYGMPTLVTSRSFCILLIQAETKPGQEFINVSVPFDHPSKPADKEAGLKQIRGTYVSVERVRKTGAADDELEWTMLNASNPSGKIPRGIANSQMPGEVAKDVPRFIDWLKKRGSIVQPAKLSRLEQ